MLFYLSKANVTVVSSQFGLVGLGTVHVNSNLRHVHGKHGETPQIIAQEIRIREDARPSIKTFLNLVNYSLIFKSNGGICKWEKGKKMIGCRNKHNKTFVRVCDGDAGEKGHLNFLLLTFQGDTSNFWSNGDRMPREKRTRAWVLPRNGWQADKRTDATEVCPPDSGFSESHKTQTQSPITCLDMSFHLCVLTSIEHGLLWI